MPPAPARCGNPPAAAAIRFRKSTASHPPSRPNRPLLGRIPAYPMTMPTVSSPKRRAMDAAQVGGRRQSASVVRTISPSASSTAERQGSLLRSGTARKPGRPEDGQAQVGAASELPGELRGAVARAVVDEDHFEPFRGKRLTGEPPQAGCDVVLLVASRDNDGDLGAWEGSAGPGFRSPPRKLRVPAETRGGPAA